MYNKNYHVRICLTFNSYMKGGNRLSIIDIIRTLNIKVDNLESVDYAFKNNHSYYFVLRGVFCLRCGRYITKIQIYGFTRLDHSIFISYHTTADYKRRRYICPLCRVTKSEPNQFQSSYLPMKPLKMFLSF